MKLLIQIVVVFMFAGVSFAGPPLVCDPQEGVEEYQIECPSATMSVQVPAEADGSLKWDLALWTYGMGWFDCTVTASYSYEAVEVATGNESKVNIISPPASIRIKIPNVKSSSGFQVGE